MSHVHVPFNHTNTNTDNSTGILRVVYAVIVKNQKFTDEEMKLTFSSLVVKFNTRNMGNLRKGHSVPASANNSRKKESVSVKVSRISNSLPKVSVPNFNTNRISVTPAYSRGQSFQDDIDGFKPSVGQQNKFHEQTDQILADVAANYIKHFKDSNPNTFSQGSELSLVPFKTLIPKQNIVLE